MAQTTVLSTGVLVRDVASFNAHIDVMNIDPANSQTVTVEVLDWGVDQVWNNPTPVPVVPSSQVTVGPHTHQSFIALITQSTAQPGLALALYEVRITLPDDPNLVVNCFADDSNGRIVEGNTVLQKDLVCIGPAMAATCVDSIKELKALTPGVVPCLGVLGYHSPGDGGGGDFYWDAAATEPDNCGTVIAPLSNPQIGRWKRMVDGTLSVRWFGASANGNDTSPIQSAIDAVPAGGGTVFFPAGVYECFGQLNLSSSNVTILGAGRDVSILRAARSFDAAFTTVFSQVQNIIFEDIQVDGNFLTQALVVLDLKFSTSATFRRCKFVRFNYGVLLQGGANVLVEDCIWDNYGAGNGTALETTLDFQHVVIRNSEFLWCGDAISLAPSGTPAQAQADVLIEGNTFDLGWYTLPALSGVTGQGKPVTYGASSLTDECKDFASLVKNGQLVQYSYIRVMTARHTGTITAAPGTGSGPRETDRLQLFDKDANFGNEILEGEIVRCGGAFAVIVSIQNQQTLNLEGWLDDTTRQPVDPPNGQYTVYGVYVGKIDVTPLIACPPGDPHTLTLYLGSRWLDLNGNPFYPPDGTPYEAIPKPNYAINANADSNLNQQARRVRVLGNTLKRGYSDQISLPNDQSMIAHNNILWGQDFGITLFGSPGKGHSIIHDNLIYRPGTGGITAETCENVDIHDNVIVGHGWNQDTSKVLFTGGIEVNECKNTHVHNNRIDGLSLPQTKWGIVIKNIKNTIITNTDSCDVLDNRIVNLANGGPEISVYQPAEIIGPRIRHDGAPPDHPSSPPAPEGTPGGVYDIAGSGSPEATFTAGPGSRYVDTVGGHFYFKSTGTGKTGWTLIV